MPDGAGEGTQVHPVLSPFELNTREGAWVGVLPWGQRRAFYGFAQNSRQKGKKIKNLNASALKAEKKCLTNRLNSILS
jgi:hypothetical protein